MAISPILTPMLGWIYDLVKVVVLLLLPFALLLRGATYIHVNCALPASVCLMAAALLTAVLMFVYFSIFYGKLTGRFGSFDALKRRAIIALLMVMVYSLHGILFISAKHWKTSDLKQEMTALHPILRLSLTSLIYLDSDLLITDASRVPEDYKKMGLKSKKTSLHYRQSSTNYAHAVDLRTKGRSVLKNTLVEWYFNLLGFNTLRHTGTADHLHVSLTSHDNPQAK